MVGRKVNLFKLRDFQGVDLEQVSRLEALGVKNTQQMLEAGRTPQLREELAKRAGIQMQIVLELVKLSDLARLPGVKGTRARLYYDAGVDTVEKLASYEPQELLQVTSEFVVKKGFLGIAPLPKEVSSTIENACHLPRVVEW